MKLSSASQAISFREFHTVKQMTAES